MGLIVFIIFVAIVIKFALPLLERVMKKKENDSREQLAQTEERLRSWKALSAHKEQFLQYLQNCSYDGKIAPWNTTYVEKQLIRFGFTEFAARQQVNEFVEQLGLKIEQLDSSYFIPEQSNQYARLDEMQRIYKSMREKGLPYDMAKRVFHYNFPDVSEKSIPVRLLAMEELDDMESAKASKYAVEINSADAHFSNPDFCAELAERIIAYTDPMIAYLKKTYPDYRVSFFNFYPAAYLINVLHEFSLEFKLTYAFNILKELSKRANYFTLMKPEYTEDNCPLIKQLWDGLLGTYRESVVKDGKEKAGVMVFVLLITNSIGDRCAESDQNMLAMAGDGLRELIKDAKELWDKYA